MADDARHEVRDEYDRWIRDVRDRAKARAAARYGLAEKITAALLADDRRLVGVDGVPWARADVKALVMRQLTGVYPWKIF